MASFINDMFSDQARQQPIVASSSSPETISTADAAARSRGYALRPDARAQSFHGTRAGVPQSEEEAAAARKNFEEFDGTKPQDDAETSRRRGYAIPPQLQPFQFNPSAGETLPERIVRKMEEEQLWTETQQRADRERLHNGGLFGLLDPKNRQRSASPPGVRPKRERTPPNNNNNNNNFSSSSSPQRSGNSPTQQQQQQKQEAELYAPVWVQSLPKFSQVNRYRPSETWAAVSPKFPSMEAVLGSHARAQQKHYEETMMGNSNSSNASRGPSALAFDMADYYSQQARSASLATQRTSHTNNTPPPPPPTRQHAPDSPAVVDPSNPFSVIINSHHHHHHHQSAAAAAAASLGDGSNKKVDVWAEAVREMNSAPGMVRATDFGDDNDDDDGQEAVNIIARNRLQSLGKTSNPHSQRLFAEFAPEKFKKERDQRAADEAAKLASTTNLLEKEQMQREQAQFQGVSPSPGSSSSSANNNNNNNDASAVAQHYAQVHRRGANNMLPPTPFSQTVPVLHAPSQLPAWHRRLEAARDLEAKASDSDSDNEDDEAIYDEFLLSEMEQAKKELPRTEKRGDFFRLPVQGQTETFLKIYDGPPPTAQQKDQNYAALEYLAVSRPEFAPALRRLAPWQMHLIDWPSLFRGGVHENVSVTAKKFPRGAAWTPSPFSEAPTQSGALGFVGNLRKREEETEFFTKLHSSNDGRIDSDEMQEWVKKAPVKFKQHD